MEKSTRFTNAWVDFANSVKSIAARQDQLVTTHRIADHVPDTVSVRQNFDGITYHKGASVMRQLVAWVGDDAFMRGVQDYFKRYRWGNADLQEFLDCLRRASGRDLTRWGQDWLQTTGLNTFRAHLAEQNGRYTSFAVEQTAIPEHPTLRAHRAGIGLYDRDAKGVLRLRRRVETDLTGAMTPITELVGERVCDLVLLNDGDLTFAKLRFDERSLETLKADLSKPGRPAGAGAVLGGDVGPHPRRRDAGTRVRRAGRSACARREGFAARRAGHQPGALRDRPLRGPGEPQRRARAPPPGRRRRRSTRRTCPPEMRLIWARILVGDRRVRGVAGEGRRHARRQREHPRHRRGHRPALADRRPARRGGPRRRRADPGDHGLGSERHRTASRHRVPRGPADRGRQGGGVAARRRCERADARAWKGATDGELSVASMSAILRGFYIGSVGVGGMMAHGPDPELLRPYVQRYLDALPAVWAERTIDEAETFTECLYPSHLVDDQVVAAIDLALEGGELPGPAVRILREGRDSTLRAQRAREVDRAPARSALSWPRCSSERRASSSS